MTRYLLFLLLLAASLEQVRRETESNAGLREEGGKQRRRDGNRWRDRRMTVLRRRSVRFTLLAWATSSSAGTMATPASELDMARWLPGDRVKALDLQPGRPTRGQQGSGHDGVGASPPSTCSGPGTSYSPVLHSAAITAGCSVSSPSHSRLRHEIVGGRRPATGRFGDRESSVGLQVARGAPDTRPTAIPGMGTICACCTTRSAPRPSPSGPSSRRRPRHQHTPRPRSLVQRCQAGRSRDSRG